MKPVIYQLVVRYFGNAGGTNVRDGTMVENGCGKFADINTAALGELTRLGVTHVWLTGALRQATLADYSALDLPADDPDVVKGRAGSFYAIRDYFDVCPDYAVDPANRMAEFDSLVGRIHAAGLRVLLDLVPNHVARGYHSVVNPTSNFGIHDDQSQDFSRENDFFYVGDASDPLQLSKPTYWNPPGVVFDGRYAPEDGSLGRRPKATGNARTAKPGVGTWYETIRLNYGRDFESSHGDYDPRPRAWERLAEIVEYWQAKGIDGFRCDMAELVPGEFWTWLISAARARRPHVLFIAEAYSNLSHLIGYGFDAIYHDIAYDTLKRIYQGKADQEDYNDVMNSPPAARHQVLEYLENHDERRIASPIVFHRPDGTDAGPEESGFGFADAGYQLAPLQFLYSRGPVLLLNGQEVGELGAGIEGYNTDGGRTTIFDYWAMPEFARWVNNGSYDGAGLSETQRTLRNFYSALLDLCQDSSIRGNGYWGLKYFNRPGLFPDCPGDLYSFARFEDNSGKALVVVANFRPSSMVNGRIRIPQALADAAGLNGNVTVRLVLDRHGQKDSLVAGLTVQALVHEGFPVSVPNQTSHVYAID